MTYDGRVCELCGDFIDVLERPGSHFHDQCVLDFITEHPNEPLPHIARPDIDHSHWRHH